MHRITRICIKMVSETHSNILVKRYLKQLSTDLGYNMGLLSQDMLEQRHAVIGYWMWCRNIPRIVIAMLKTSLNFLP